MFPRITLRNRELGPSLRLQRLLEAAARLEARNGRGGDVHLLAGIARIDALAGRALRGGELPEPGEGHRISPLERLRDALEECVHGLRRVAPVEAALTRNLV